MTDQPGDVIRLSDLRQTVPDMSIGAEQDDQPVEQPAGWQRIDLNDPQYLIPPEPPALLGMVYTGLRHVISGAPESAKTLIAYIALHEHVRGGHKGCIVDMEMGPKATRRVLGDLGFTAPELDHLYYVEPDTPPEDAYQAIIEWGATLVLIDAAAGAYDRSGLDDNARKDVEAFARQWVTPLFQAGITTIVVDHVTKNADTRGKFTIGSERKVGQADVHLGMDAVKALARGSKGVVKVVVHKDRPGYLTRPTHCVFELDSSPDAHAITWRIREPETTAPEDTWRPTILMERVSRYLEQHTEPVSRTQIETNVKGKSAKVIRQAIDALLDDGFAVESAGARGARNVTLVTKYRQPETVTSDTVSHPVYPMVEPNGGVTSGDSPNSTPSDPVPPRLDGVTTTPSDGVPLTGAPTGSDTTREPHPVQDGDGVDDITTLTDKYADQLYDDGIPW